jgi:hypothetical protein
MTKCHYCLLKVQHPSIPHLREHSKKLAEAIRLEVGNLRRVFKNKATKRYNYLNATLR